MCKFYIKPESLVIINFLLFLRFHALAAWTYMDPKTESKEVTQ